MDLEARFERGHLADTATGGIAAHARLRVRDPQLDDCRKLSADGVAVELLNLHDDEVGLLEPVPRLESLVEDGAGD